MGEEVVHLEEWWGEQVSCDFVFFQLNEMAELIRAAGFVIERSEEREPYPGVEHPSRRGYILARKPGSLRL